MTHASFFLQQTGLKERSECFWFVLLTVNKGWSSLCQQQPNIQIHCKYTKLLQIQVWKLCSCFYLSCFLLFFLFPLDSLHPLMLFAYEGHMPVSCQHACPLFSLRFCQTRPHCCHQSAEHTTQPSIHTSSATPLLPRIQDHSPATRSVRDQTGTQYIDLFYYHPSSPLVLSASHSLNMSYISPHFHGLVFIFSYC